jgi:transposase
VEKTSTDLAHQFDVIAVEKLDVKNKAPGRVVLVNAAYTSQTCSVCGFADSASRKSQARFACTSCGYTGHADVNAARNIRDRATGHQTAGGRLVAARGGAPPREPVIREPQLVTSSTGA